MAGKDGVGEVVEAVTTPLAFLTLTVRLGVIPAVLDDRGRGAMGAGDALWPAHVPDGLVALGVVEKILDIDHRETPLTGETD
jgi:hypothetical protein